MVKTPIKYLLQIYLIIPICIAVASFDYFLTGGALKSILPRDPNGLALFNFFFVLPHILASTFIFFQREYVQYYKRSIFISLVAVSFLAFLAPQIFSKNFVLIINGLLTIYHVMVQQFGLAGGFAGNKGKSFQVWKYTGLIASGFIYHNYYFSDKLGPAVQNYLYIAITLLIVAFAISSFFFLKKTSPGIGRKYGIANFFLVLAPFIFLMIDQPFYAVVIPRVVHDVTAFVFYGYHNVNRFSSYPVSIVVALTLGTAILASQFIYHSNIFVIFNFFTLLHYATECFTWKSGTLHRKYIEFC
jgi:hypothetical protein